MALALILLLVASLAKICSLRWADARSIDEGEVRATIPMGAGCLLALHDKQIDHELRPLPPFATFRKWGIFMPVVSVNGAPWEKESSDILVTLVIRRLQVEICRLCEMLGEEFYTELIIRYGFLRLCSTAHTSSSTFAGLVQDALRSFVPFYMFTLINVAKVRSTSQA